MKTRIIVPVFIAFLLISNMYLLYDYNSFAGQHTGTRMEMLRTRAELKDLRRQVQDFDMERSLIGRRLPDDCVENYLAAPRTVLLLATSQDCAPCTETELELWQRFLSEKRLKLPVRCLYYRFSAGQYGKYEDVYREVFEFSYEEFGLYEDLGIDDTPLALLVDGAGTILLAHRPDVMKPGKTKAFLEALSRLTVERREDITADALR